MRQVAAVVGNSSSGLIEAPSFGIPTLNIGERQNGRIAADSVWNCASDKASVLSGFDKVLSKDFRNMAGKTHNPYEKDNTAELIFNVISSFSVKLLTHKIFYDVYQ